MSSIPPPKKDAPNNFALGICSLQYYSIASHNPILSSRGRRKTAHFENKCVSNLLPAPSVCFTDFAGNRTAAGKLFPCLEPGAVHQKLPSISGVHPMKHEENQKRVEKSVSEQEKCWIILGKYVIIRYYVSESTHEGNRSDALPIKKESWWL